MCVNNIYHATERPNIHRDTYSSGTDHDQISLRILESRYGQSNDLGILQREKEKLNELSRKKVSKFCSA